MDIIRDPKTFQRTCRELPRQGRTTALVPTMGFFHDGHLALMDKARELADTVLVSLFVNPTQFGPAEDLDKYPRDLDRDQELARQHGAAILFAPEPDTMYAPGHATWVQVPELSTGLCGASRPTHFRGVCTVVAKLFHLASPTYAVFGEKDWQQLAIIRRMVKDLDFDVRVVGHPIVREPDGLALSSRNVNLDPDERAQAPAIQAGLKELEARIRSGEASAEALLAGLRAFYAERLPLGRVDYAELVDPDSLEPLGRVAGPVLAAVAVHMRRARLIDNLRIEV